MKTGELAVDTYLDALAAKLPTPGGGGAAALTGSQGAALLSMVVNFTLGNQKYAAVEDEMAGYLKRTEHLRAQLTALADRDVEAFDAVAVCYDMPNSTPEEKDARTAAMQSALQGASEVPLVTATRCLDVMQLVEPICRKGNTNVISDAVTALYLANSGLQSAIVNVNVNLQSIKDRAFVAKTTSRRDDLLGQAQTVYLAACDTCAEVLGFPL